MHSWCIPGALLVHSWCTPGALLVHSWCTPGALLVHSWCTPGALLVHSWCTPGALLVHSWCTPGAFFGALLVHSRCTPKVSRKGIDSLPKGSLDPPHRNVWIAFSLTHKPERELHRFRKEASILRTETFGSPFRQFANPKGNCTASERKSRSSAQKRFGSPFRQLANPKGIAPLPKGSLDLPHRNVFDRLFANLQTRKGLHRFRKEASIFRTETFWIAFSPTCKPEREIAPLPKGSLDPPHRNVWIAQDITTFITERGVTTTRPQQNTPQTLPTERSMNGPGAHPAQRAAGTCRCVSTATFILRTAFVALEATAQPRQPPRVRQLGET